VAAIWLWGILGALLLAVYVVAFDDGQLQELRRAQSDSRDGSERVRLRLLSSNRASGV